MKILLKFIDPKKKPVTFNITDFTAVHANQVFQNFVEHFKHSGSYFIEDHTRAILFHTVDSIEVVPDEKNSAV